MNPQQVLEADASPPQVTLFLRPSFQITVLATGLSVRVTAKPSTTRTSV
jgi:hypothetical protein